MAECKKCHAPIRWVETLNGKRMPLDQAPNPAGNVVLRNGVACVVRADDSTTLRRYMAHFASCAGLSRGRQHDG